MATTKTIKQLATYVWAKDNIANRTDIATELYNKGFSYLNSHPMNINQYDVIFNQFDRKSNYALNQILSVINESGLEFGENNSLTLLNAIKAKTTDNGFGTSAPLLPVGTDLHNTDILNKTAIYTLNGSYINGPYATANGVMLVIKRLYDTNGALYFYYDEMGVMVKVCINSKNKTFSSWFNNAYSNKDNKFSTSQTFNAGLYDSITQFGLMPTSNGTLKTITTDSDIIKFSLGARFYCDLSKYTNTPDSAVKFGYIERIGSSNGGAGYGLFKLIINKKEWLGYYESGTTITWTLTGFELSSSITSSSDVTGASSKAIKDLHDKLSTDIISMAIALG